MTNDSPIARRVEREVMADRVAAHLGLDPMEVVAESLTLSPVAGDKVLVRWEGIKLVSSEEAARALGVAPDREVCPQPCEHLSQHDAREGRTCPEHPCTCTDRENRAEPKHTESCAERCNHCQVCGTGIMYGSRCPDHYQGAERENGSAGA